MFYYRIIVSHTERSQNALHIEALKPSYVSEKVASLLGNCPARVTVEPISQRDYLAAVRPGE